MKLNVNHLELEKVLFLFPLLSGYFSKFARTATVVAKAETDKAHKANVSNFFIIILLLGRI